MKIKKEDKLKKVALIITLEELDQIIDQRVQKKIEDLKKRA